MLSSLDLLCTHPGSSAFGKQSGKKYCSLQTDFQFWLLQQYAASSSFPAAAVSCLRRWSEMAAQDMMTAIWKVKFAKHQYRLSLCNAEGFISLSLRGFFIPWAAGCRLMFYQKRTSDLEQQTLFPAVQQEFQPFCPDSW